MNIRATLFVYRSMGTLCYSTSLMLSTYFFQDFEMFLHMRTTEVTHLVVNISDVHAVEDVVVEVVLKNSPQNVYRNIRPGMAHVRGIVDCGPTAVPENTASFLGDKLLLQINSTL